MSRPRLTQLIFIFAAVALLVAAGLLQRPLDRIAKENELVSENEVVAKNYPQIALLTKVFGGLRAPVVSFLWIRAEQHKQAGRYFDAMQLADIICQLQPRFSGVWSFHAWNMAWNISVTTHTPEERWLWVTNGMRLLRDRGIPLNPRSLILYKELAWIFFSKMGGHTDEMHGEYKRRWTAEMQALLGAPPLGTTKKVIAAFRPIADEHLLDDDPARQGAEEIQSDKFDELLSDKAVKNYLDELQKRFAAGDDKLAAQPLIEFANRHLLDIYNRYSLDESVAVARPRATGFKTDKDKNLSAWINSRPLKPYRQKLLDFVRAQKLWNIYRMDPRWMLDLMERYRVPLDWRLVRSHGLYWSSYGVHVCRDVDITKIDSLNTDRILLFCLRDMTFYGKLVYRPNPRNGDVMETPRLGDWRFIEPAHDEYVRWGQQERKARGKEFKENIFRDGHINYLIAAIKMLYAGGRRVKAQKWMDWIRDNYKPEGSQWNFDLDAFVRFQLLKDGAPTLDIAVSQLTAAVQGGFESLARGGSANYADSLGHAAWIYNLYMKKAQKRLRIPPLSFYEASVLAGMLVRPEAMGVRLDLIDRSRLYNMVGAGPRGNGILVLIYDRIAPALRRLCEREKLSFERAFPPPSGLKRFRESQRRFSPAK